MAGAAGEPAAAAIVPLERAPVALLESIGGPESRYQWSPALDELVYIQLPKGANPRPYPYGDKYPPTPDHPSGRGFEIQIS